MKDLKTIQYVKKLIEESMECIVEEAETDLANYFDKDEIIDIKAHGINEFLLNADPNDELDYQMGKYTALHNLWHDLNADEQELMKEKE